MTHRKGKKDYLPIDDYGIIGDSRCAALISSEGAIDWLCLPRFDSSSIFGAILDTEKGGHFTIRPAGPFTTQRRYVDDTNVLETTFRTDTGVLQLTDLMPIYSWEDRRRTLCPERQVLRRLECTEGEVQLMVHYEPRLDYGRHIPRLIDRRPLGIYCEQGKSVFILGSEVPLELSADRSCASGQFTLREGDRRFLDLTYSQTEPAVLPLFGEQAETRMHQTIQWWRNWIHHCDYDGPYREAVIRSALTLKLTIYAPSGAVIAAPTASLPEGIGGSRNWDYRYCWLRDASMTLRALFRLGYKLEGEAFLSWLIHSTRLTRPRLQVAYDVYGETNLQEKELDHLEGYRSTKPVRVGNGAGNQLQLDVYGEVIQGAYEYMQTGETFGHQTAKMLVGLGNTVCRLWQEPDKGIWEIRTDPRHNTHSKVMCWTALDRLLRMYEAGHIRKMPVEKFQETRDAIRAEIEKKAFDSEINSYVGYFGSKSVDISLFTLPINQYIAADDPRMVATYKTILHRLEKNGLLYRFPFGYDGIQEGEGTFTLANFLAAECLARMGEMEAARERFEHTLSFANDIGLFSEEIDPDTGASLGNFPQAYTHIGLINTASTLAKALK